MAGLDLPIIPVRHEFCITVPCDDMNPNLPVLRIPDLGIYIRAEVNSILIGGWESTALSLDPRQRSAQDPMPAIEEDWDVLAGFAKKMSSMLPCLKSLGIRHVFKGWPTFVPDGKFIIGESRNCPGFIMAGGCNAHGVSGSAGIGRHVVESMLDEDPSDYVKSLSPDRFLDQEWDWQGAQQQAKNVYQTYYSIDH
ncbi:MAG TPA: FAD-binding oxidoreductase [Verrucomicrobiales bacterium]|nr:FAD-binding oxidoreductase [Verrucomicrobiales bacterium]